MNRLKRVRISSFILSIILFSSLSWAQHFLFTDLTGNNMTVVVPTSIAPTIDGSPIEIGDEIGVFTPADLCVGASVWTGSNIAITVWGDDDQTGGDPDGMVTGEALSFKMWDASASTEYDAVVTYSSGVGTYTPDGISVLASLVGMVPPEITLDPVSQDKYVGEDVDFTIAATGTAPITYQWKKDGADLPGETGTTLSLTSLTLADEGDYTCVATNAVGSDESTAATLTVSIRPAITVTSPNGGNLLVVGTTYEITWSSEGTIVDNLIKIEYSINNGSDWTEETGSTENDGSYMWTVPDAVSTNCLIKISEVFDGDPFDVSDAVFEIEPAPAIMVTYPDGGETLYIGSTVDITWTDAGTVGAVKIEYSTDGGSTYPAMIIASTPNTGSYSWTVPADVSTLCRIKVSETDGIPTDESDANFTIAYQQQTIDLPAGWNMISCNLDPVDANVSVLFNDIGSLVLVKNNAGKIYMPQYSIDDIGAITITEGYKVYSTVADVLTVSGTAVDVTATSVPLSAGWNMVAYLPQSLMTTETALADIMGELTLVKDINGVVYSPVYTVYELVNMEPGLGYKMHMKTAASFNYPASLRSEVTTGKTSKVSKKQPVHFTCAGNTGNNMTVIIPTTINPIVNGNVIDNNDEIGVFTSAGLCVGSRAWNGNNTAIAVWGDNDQTPEVDGIKTGENLFFRVWDESADEEYTAEVTFASGGPDYSVDGIALLANLQGGNTSVIEINPVSIQKEQFAVTPNPVATDGKVDLYFMGKIKKEAELVIYDQVGNRVYEDTYPFIGGVENRANRFGQWNLKNRNGRKVASGTYLAILTVTGDNGRKERYRVQIGVKEY